ncbi:hypothetical protein STH12_03571 [Shewanella khirikhana]|uniref:Uncharacterized protein n=2 Tax=Shewanella khirikhana TaxID=1965282 RepID=A0ABM7DSE6_9GAMM|nr:hypothetical protein STH12_03571 [Shewanella khirikhana]
MDVVADHVTINLKYVNNDTLSQLDDFLNCFYGKVRRAVNKEGNMKNLLLTHALPGLAYLGLSWFLLLWLNFQLPVSPLVHFLALPVLMLLSGLGAALLWQRGCRCD